MSPGLGAKPWQHSPIRCHVPSRLPWRSHCRQAATLFQDLQTPEPFQRPRRENEVAEHLLLVPRWSSDVQCTADSLSTLHLLVECHVAGQLRCSSATGSADTSATLPTLLRGRSVATRSSGCHRHSCSIVPALSALGKLQAPPCHDASASHPASRSTGNSCWSHLQHISLPPSQVQP